MSNNRNPSTNKFPKRISNTELRKRQIINKDNTHPIFQVVRNDKVKLYKPLTEADKDQAAEVESFNSYCSRLLLGENACKTRVVEKDGKDVGVLIDVIKDFYSMDQVGEWPTVEQLIISEIGKVWVAGYVDEEEDNNVRNYGFQRKSEGNADTGAKIDHGRSSISVSGKFIEDIAEDWQKGKIRLNQIFPKYYKEIQDEIRSFPVLKHSSPHAWPDRDNNFGTAIVPGLAELSKRPEFIEQKYYMFLKRILIADSVYQGIGEKSIKENDLREELIQDKIQRTKQLKHALVKMPEFDEYLRKNNNVIEQIKSEFKAIDGKGKFQIDLAEVEENYKSILKVTADNFNGKKEQKSPASKSQMNTIDDLLNKLKKHNPVSSNSISHFIDKGFKQLFPNADALIGYTKRFSNSDPEDTYWFSIVFKEIVVNPLFSKQIIVNEKDFAGIFNTIKSNVNNKSKIIRIETLKLFFEMLEKNIEHFKPIIHNYLKSNNSDYFIDKLKTLHFEESSDRPYPALIECCENIPAEVPNKIHEKPTDGMERSTKPVTEQNEMDSVNSKRSILLGIFTDENASINTSSKIINDRKKTERKLKKLSDLTTSVNQCTDLSQLKGLLESSLTDKEIIGHRNHFGLVMNLFKKSTIHSKLLDYLNTNLKDVPSIQNKNH